MMKQDWSPEIVAAEATETLAAIAEKMATAPPEVVHELTRLRAGMDQYRLALRAGDWSDGQIGVIVFDALQKAGNSHGVCILVAMECLK